MMRVRINSVAKLLLLTILSLIILQFSSTKVSAVTPPDACFAFDGAGTITEYYFYEGNDSANLECPKDVDIPSTISGIPVTTIGDWAMWEKELTSVTFPSSVSTIGVYAFDSNYLSSVIIPDTVTTLSEGAFDHNQLTSVTISNSITELSPYVFAYNQLTSVTLPNVTSIGDGAFSTNLLASIDIPNTVVSIGNDSFYRNQLTSATLSNSLTTIESSAFGLNYLTSVTIPDSVTSIGIWAFNRNQLTSVNIPNSVASIGDKAFALNSTAYRYTDIAYFGGPVPDADFLNTVIYVQLLTADPTNPNGLTDNILFESNSWDFNHDGDTIDALGGHIINPASVILNYVDESNAALLPSSQIYLSDTLTSYLVTENPTNDLSLYWRSGPVVSYSAPAITGYTTPADANITLLPGLNAYNFIYIKTVDTTNTGTSSSDTSSTDSSSVSSSSVADTVSSGSTLASTGQNLNLIAVIAGFSNAVALILMAKLRLDKRF